MSELQRFPIEPAPAKVPPAPLRGSSFVLADGRMFSIPPPTLAQIHGSCAASFAVIVNIIAANQWGVAFSVRELTYHVVALVWAAMSRNYDIQMWCPAAKLTIEIEEQREKTGVWAR